ncbi:MAG: dihydrofolate reductase, partial [Bacteroidales bacterium]|nr:dihydrofolate reductase [Bacteroidales bacterium]
AIALAKKLTPESEIFIIGGGSLYRQAIGVADRLYITHVHTFVDNADTFFPIIDRSVWKIIEQTPAQTDEKSGYNIQFVTYGKIN